MIQITAKIARRGISEFNCFNRSFIFSVRMSLIWALILEIPGWTSLNAVYLHGMTNKTPDAAGSRADCTLSRQLSQHRTLPVTAMPSCVLQHAFNIGQQWSVASGEKRRLLARPLRRLDFEGESPGEIGWPHYWEFESDRLLSSLFFISSPKNSHKDVLMAQESHENIQTQHWEETLACLPHTLLTCIVYSFLQSMLFFPLEMSEVASCISSFNSALTYMVGT